MGKIWSRKKVAVIFDFDKTLSVAYQQRCIFEDLGIDEPGFWKQSGERAALFGGKNYAPENYEFSYMNLLADYLYENNKSSDYLNAVAKNIEIYPGASELIANLLKTGIEVYLVSSGIKSLIIGSPLYTEVRSRLEEADLNPDALFTPENVYASSYSNFRAGELPRILNVMNSYGKAMIIDWISRGCNVLGMDYIAPLGVDDRRIPFNNMIVIGDGPSDVPNFNLVKGGGGLAWGVHNPNEPAQLRQLASIFEDGRLDGIGVADYRKGSVTGDWIHTNAVELFRKLDYRTPDVDLEAFKAYYKNNKTLTFVHAWTK